MNNKNFLKILLFLISSLLIYYVNAGIIKKYNSDIKVMNNAFYVRFITYKLSTSSSLSISSITSTTISLKNDTATINTINLKEIYKLQHNEFYEELKIRNISIKVRHEFVDLINA